MRNIKVLFTGEIADPIKHQINVALDGSGTIKEVSSYCTENCAESIDCSGRLVMPGFVNMHSHAPLPTIPDALHSKDFDTWLGIIQAAEKKMALEDFRVNARNSFLKLISSGITTTNEMYFHGDIIAEVARNIGIRAAIAHCPNPSLSFEEQISDQLHVVSTITKNGGGLTYPVLHASLSLEETALTRISEVSRKTGMLLHMHLPQSKGIFYSAEIISFH